jgi:beta-lactamase class A
MKLLKIFIFSLIYWETAMAQSSIAELKNRIEDYFKSVAGTFAVAYYNLSTDEELLINDKETFHAASTMKTPVMIEVFKQEHLGIIKTDKQIIVENEFKSIVDSSVYSMDIGEDSGEELYKYIGQKRTVRELVFDMITVSSNLATNILIELVNPENIMTTMKEIGADDIKVLRGVEDIKAFNLGLNNTITAYDLMIIFKKIASYELISEKVCNEMINILLNQKLKNKIPARLPFNVKVAHKTGSITGVEHDSGIVFLPDGNKYVLVLLSKNLSDQQTGINALAEVSKMIYDYVINED